MSQGNLEKMQKVREKSGNFKFICHFKFAYLQTILLFTCTKRYACFLADYKT